MQTYFSDTEYKGGLKVKLGDRRCDKEAIALI